MSNLPTIPELTTDITEDEMKKIERYTEDGMPGISSITPSQVYQMLDLYLGGSTYTQIASTLEKKKAIILYLAHSNNWYAVKKEYMSEIQEKIKNRVVDSKLRSQEFMLLLVQAWQKRIGKQLTKYLSTNDEDNMENVNLKEVAQLMKAIELINELDSSGRGNAPKSPTVGLNLGSGVTVEKVGENKISITPKGDTFTELLKQHADARREEDNKKILSKPLSDIDNNNGESK